MRSSVSGSKISRSHSYPEQTGLKSGGLFALGASRNSAIPIRLRTTTPVDVPLVLRRHLYCSAFSLAELAVPGSRQSGRPGRCENACPLQARDERVAIRVEVRVAPLRVSAHVVRKRPIGLGSTRPREDRSQIGWEARGLGSLKHKLDQLLFLLDGQPRLGAGVGLARAALPPCASARFQRLTLLRLAPTSSTTSATSKPSASRLAAFKYDISTN